MSERMLVVDDEDVNFGLRPQWLIPSDYDI
jgi:hypothetical protein